MKLAACVLALFVGVGCAAPAAAHGFMDHSSPAAGSTVHGPPEVVTLSFSQAVEPAFSTLQVIDKDGKQVDRKDKRADVVDPTLLRVSLPPLAPGTYRVIWRVLYKDGHVTRGSFTFEVTP